MGPNFPVRNESINEMTQVMVTDSLTHVGCEKRCKAREEVEALYKACDLPDVPYDVDEFDDEGFEDDEFYE